MGGGCKGIKEQKHKERVRIREIHPQGEHNLSHTLTSLTVYTHTHSHVTLETGLSHLKETKRNRKRERQQERERETDIPPSAQQGLSRKIFCWLL